MKTLHNLKKNNRRKWNENTEFRCKPFFSYVKRGTTSYQYYTTKVLDVDLDNQSYSQANVVDVSEIDPDSSSELMFKLAIKQILVLKMVNQILLKRMVTQILF